MQITENSPVFRLICSRPKIVLWASLLLILISGFGVTNVTKNPSVDAFVNSASPTVKARDLAADIFGVEDPAIIAVVHPRGETLFTPQHLTAFQQLNERVQGVSGVQSDKVRSLATEFFITSEEGELIVDPVIPDGDISLSMAGQALENARLMPMFEQLLYSKDGSALLIVAPVLDPDDSEPTLVELKALQEEFSNSDREIHIAGVAAMNAQMARSISRDTKVFVPGCIFVVLSIVFIAVRRLSGMIGPVLVVAGACATAVGLMGWAGKDYYLVTTVLPVLVVSIAVADSLHILSAYLSVRSKTPHSSSVEAMQIALRQTWHPVSLTSLTTVAGFIGMSVGSPIIPIAEFGWFAAAGVIAAWFLSLTLLPAVIILTDLRPHAKHSNGGMARIDGLLAYITKLSASFPKTIVVGAIIGFVGLATIASMIQFDYARARYFAPSDPILLADETINERFAGTNIIDILVSAPEVGGIETESAISSIRDLQSQLMGLPNAQKVSSIADHIELLHEHLTDAAQGTLPTKPSAVSQYLFIFEASGGPQNLSDRLDFNRQHALLRIYLNEDSYLSTLRDVEMAEKLVAQWEIGNPLSAQVSGRIPVNASWMGDLKASHPVGVGTAFVLIFLFSLMLFRSVTTAVLSFVPVVFGVTSIYAAMAFLNIDLAPATSMCAAISAGLGIDFGTHIVATLRNRNKNPGEHAELPIVVRACCYSMLSLSLGLSVTILSEVPALQWYGLFISVGAIASFLSAIIILPAAFQLTASISNRFQKKERSYA